MNKSTPKRLVRLIKSSDFPDLVLLFQMMILIALTLILIF